MQALSRSEPRPGRGALVALIGIVAVIAMTFVARPAEAATVPTCPGFKVVHDDRIGAVAFPAGTYTITVQSASLTCKSSAELFAGFLEKFDGALPAPWQIVPGEGSGTSASFTRGPAPGFSVELTTPAKGGEAGGNPDLGTVCPKHFTVTSSTLVGSLRFTKGAFLIDLPSGSGITCNRASVLFTGFLAAGGPLPPPWKLIARTATFYKPSNPTRSAFRIEPLNAAGAR